MTEIRFYSRGCAFITALLIVGVMVARGAQGAPAPRLVERFDRDWRFLRGDAPDAWSPGFDDSRWRRVDLPHDASIEDLSPVDSPARPTLSVVPGAWRFKFGDDPAWKQPIHRETEVEIWDAPLLRILFIVPLGVEWLVRKRVGMLRDVNRAAGMPAARTIF